MESNSTADRNSSISIGASDPQIFDDGSRRHRLLLRQQHKVLRRSTTIDWYKNGECQLHTEHSARLSLTTSTHSAQVHGSQKTNETAAQRYPHGSHNLSSAYTNAKYLYVVAAATQIFIDFTACIVAAAGTAHWLGVHKYSRTPITSVSSNTTGETPRTDWRDGLTWHN